MIVGNDTAISSGKLPGPPRGAKGIGSKGHSIAAEALLLLLIIVFCIFPFYWMVTTSLKTQLEALASPPTWIFEPTFANYIKVLFEDKVGHSLINSLIVAVCTTALALALGVPAAYALSRFEFRRKKDLWFWFITNRMVSPIVLALPFFLIVRKLGMLDTHIVPPVPPYPHLGGSPCRY